MDCVNSKGLTVALFLASAVNFPLHFLGRKIFIYVPIITADNLDTDSCMKKTQNLILRKNIF